LGLLHVSRFAVLVQDDPYDVAPVKPT
jgi:hypothetical protein